MIIDTLSNASKYASLNPLFAKAFDFMNQNDIATLENGVIQIEEGLKVIVSTANGKTAEVSLAKFECHDKNIDIQCNHPYQLAA